MEFEFSKESFKTCEKYFDKHLVASISKSRDIALYLCSILQVIEMAIDFLSENEAFKKSSIEAFNQPLLPMQLLQNLNAQHLQLN